MYSGIHTHLTHHPFEGYYVTFIFFGLQKNCLRRPWDPWKQLGAGHCGWNCMVPKQRQRRWMAREGGAGSWGGKRCKPWDLGMARAINQWILVLGGESEFLKLSQGSTIPETSRETDLFFFLWMIPNFHEFSKLHQAGLSTSPFQVDPSSSMLLALYVLICWLQTAAEQLHVPDPKVSKRRWDGNFWI